MIRDILCAGRATEDGLHTLRMRVDETGGGLDYTVMLSQDDLATLGQPGESPEEFVIRCFEFLLDREPKESILRIFNANEISRYFPDFAEQMATDDSEDSY